MLDRIVMSLFDVEQYKTDYITDHKPCLQQTGSSYSNLLPKLDTKVIE